MHPFLWTFRLLVLVGGSLGAGLSAFAQLSANSPFLPPQAAGAAAPTQTGSLEYAGYFSTAQGMMYVLKDPAKKASAYVRLNERDSALEVVVKKHDAGQNTITIEHQGRTLTLEPRKAKIISSGNPAMMAAPVPLPQPVVANVAPAVTQSVVVNPTPADEQKRLEAVASEVARRRALREQAAGQVPGATPAQPAAGPVPPPQAAPNLQVQPAQR